MLKSIGCSFTGLGHGNFILNQYKPSGYSMQIWFFNIDNRKPGRKIDLVK